MFGLAYKARLPSPYIVLDPGPYIFAIDSTFGDGKSIEESAVTVLFERPGVKFPIGQVLSVQIGIISDVCNNLALMFAVIWDMHIFPLGI
uniref:Putative ovule protein n=1 Tax=Solanum chacoense TaxID=4108 RepID=A0A0V0I9L9_SOLCH